MKRIFVFTFFLGFFTSLTAMALPQSQQGKIDSLQNVIKYAKEDTNKVKALLSLSNRLSTNEPEKSLAYAQQSLTLAQKLNAKRYIIYSNQRIAGYYYYKGDLNSATEYSMKAIDIIRQINDKRALAFAYSNLSSLFARRSDTKTAIDYVNKSLAISSELKDSVSMANDLSNKGMIYMNISDYTNSLNYFLQSLKISEAIRYKTGMAVNYSNLATFYRYANNDFDKSIYYYQQALTLNKETNDLLQTASTLEHMGEAYFDHKDLNKALECFEQSLAIEKSIKNILNISYCIRNIGMIYNSQGNYDKALTQMPEALRLAQQTEDKTAIGDIYQCMAEIYMNKKEYNTAITYLNKGLDLAREANERKNEALIVNDIASCYELLNNFKTANQYLRRYDTLKESILNQATMKKNSEMEALYNSDKKDKEITLLTKDKEIQQLEIKKQVFFRNAFVTGLFFLLILLVFIYRNYHTRQLLKLQTLRTKIASDLHDDIGSTLTSISIFSLMARNESKEIIPMLDQIGENCRKMLDSMADIVWTINPENDNFEKIIYRMRSFAFELLRSKNIDFEFNTDDSVTNMKLSMETRKNLYLIFKEATNNLVKYADANRATFSLISSKNNLTMLIRDNGKGFDIKHQGQGNGLKNMKNRALEIGADFLIESEPGRGTTIQLLIKTA